MEQSVENLFQYQSMFVRLPQYENEFETMRLQQDRPERMREMCHKMSWTCLQNLLEQQKSELLNENCMIQQSNRLRAVGNKFFTTKDDTRDILRACRFYTEAIFAAPSRSESLALAHANRAMALQEFGYFQQAYDDCECALHNGYPDRLLHKIVTRQSYCAWQLGDGVRMKLHLDALDELSLNDKFKQQVKELRVGLQNLLQNPVKRPNQDEQELPTHRETQEIIKTTGPRGRYMIATTQIAKNELIFSERASSFVPVGDWRICQHCAATQLIPFPCMECRGRVVYCSLKCMIAHAATHAHECAAYQRDLFSHVGISHLAFRMVLDGLPQVLPYVRHLHSAQQVWMALMGDDIGDAELHGNQIEYMQTLQMVTHLGEMTLADIVWFVLVAQVLVVYLQHCTNFLTILECGSGIDKSEWELIVGALILRHIGQMIVNGHSCVSIVPQRVKSGNPLLDSSLLASGIWCAPYRVKRGCLHKFCDYDEVAAANFSYLSICNHACEQSFQPRFSGRWMSTFATKELPVGAEITNCYTLDYRKSRRQARRADLKDIYKFECNCERCVSSQPDEQYESFHRYRCENSSCRREFVPKLPHLRTLNWWDSKEGLPPGIYMRCHFCRAQQFCHWFTSFNNLLSKVRNASAREQLFDEYAALDNWLLGYNEAKLFLSYQLVSDCFAAHNAGYFLEDAEFGKIAAILKFYLNGVALQSQTNSIEYVVKMTFLWDFIALKKYECSRDEMSQMLQAIEIASDEVKNIFLHYYKDYVESLIS